MVENITIVGVLVKWSEVFDKYDSEKRRFEFTLGPGADYLSVKLISQKPDNRVLFARGWNIISQIDIDICNHEINAAYLGYYT